jgi:hypothetical protein
MLDLYGVLFRMPIGNSTQTIRLNTLFRTEAEAVAAGLREWGLDSQRNIEIFRSRGILPDEEKYVFSKG